MNRFGLIQWLPERSKENITANKYEGGGATKYGGFGGCGDTSRGLLIAATLLERDDLLQQYRNLDWKSK